MRKFLIIFTALLVLSPGLAKADGALFSPPLYYMHENEQRAVIWQEGNSETLILSFEFKGDAKDFGWVVPTPTQPQVSKSSDELFTSLAKLTTPEIDQVEAVPLMMAPNTLLEDKGVAVVEAKEVGIYKTSILKASDQEALYNWLKENGYQYPEQGKYILDEYIQKGWFFTACQVRPEAASELTAEQLRGGHATPLKLKFASDKIIYPLKISSLIQYQDAPQINEKISVARKSVAITLYVFSNHKQDLPGFTANYAQWLKPSKISKLAYEDGAPWQNTSKKMYLTKFYRQMYPAEMTDDLVLRDADDNKAIGGHVFQWVKLTIGLLWALAFLVIFCLSPVGLVFLVCAILGFFVRNLAARIIFWIIQGLVFLLTSLGIAGLIYYLLAYLSPYSSLWTNLELWLPSLAIIFLIYLAMVVLMILEAKKQKRQPLN